MRPTKIVVRTRVSAKQCAKWKGKHPTPDHYSFVIENDTDVYGADGTFIIGYRKNCISEAALNESYEAYHWMRRFTRRDRYDGTSTGCVNCTPMLMLQSKPIA